MFTSQGLSSVPPVPPVPPPIPLSVPPTPPTPLTQLPPPASNVLLVPRILSNLQATATTRSEFGVKGGPEVQQTRGTKWEAWEDRALVRQVLADDPLNCIRGRTPEKWQDVSKHLAELQPKAMQRSSDSCRSRLKKLVLWHKVSNRSQALIGEDED